MRVGALRRCRAGDPACHRTLAGVQPMPLQQRAVKAAVGILVVRSGLILLGRRKGSHGAGTWSAPGGRMEYGETIEQAARR